MSTTNTNTTTADLLRQQYVEPGACLVKLQNGNAILTACALEPGWCPSSAGIAGRTVDEFVSSRQLHRQGPSTPGYSCLASDGTDPRHYVRLGRCASAVDNYVCTSVADNCKNGAAFETIAEMCTLLADLAPDRKDQERTLFSGCHDPQTEPVDCYWSSADCPLDQGYQAFGARPYSDFLECPCEKTRVGACQSKDSEDYFCAPSAKSCDANSTFVSVKDLEHSAGIECRLCREPSRIPEAIITGTSARPTSTGTVGNSASSASPITTPGGSDNESGINSNASIAAIVGGVVGGLVLAAIVTLAMHSVRRRRGRSQGKTGGTAIVVELAAEDSTRTSSADNPSSSCDISSSGGTASEVERAEYS